MLPLWPQYYNGACAIIYCIDRCDAAALAPAGLELYDLLAVSVPSTGHRPHPSCLHIQSEAFPVKRVSSPSSLTLFPPPPFIMPP